MDSPQPLRRIIIFAGLLGLVTFALCFHLSPPPLTDQWNIAFAVLLGLNLLTAILALRVTESGTTASMDFVPRLGAVVLLGPAGAVSLTAVAETISQAALSKKPVRKVIYNVGQSVVSIGLASLAYTGLGGQPSLNQLNFTTSFAPFMVAALIDFAVNTTAVIFIISYQNKKPFFEVYDNLLGATALFEIVISTLAFLVAYLYIRWGPLALLAAVLPLIGLRYSYGVNLELRQLNRDLLRVLIKTLEAQDPYTSGHSVRVAEYAKRIAQKLRLSPNDISSVETAALLHDIGKIDNRYHAILRQEGPLTDEQRDLIEKHPKRGVAIVKSVRSIDPDVLDFIHHHHERYDGTGYPDKLKGDDIPVGSRIIMVADTIDAMRTARPYRDAVPIDAIKKELRNQKGSQFDPEVVNAALEAQIVESIDREKVKDETSLSII